MSAPIVLLADERGDGERLTVRWLESDSGGHRLEISIDCRAGDGWTRGYYVSLGPGEVFRLHDAIGMALWHASQVRR